MGKTNRSRPCAWPGCPGHAEPRSALCLQCQLLGREPPTRAQRQLLELGVSAEVVLGRLAGRE